MWSRSYGRIVVGVSRERLWTVWTDVDRWHTWQDDLDDARLLGRFEPGGRLRFKPKGGPTFTLELTEVNVGHSFTDVTRFPLARMYDAHELIERGGAVELRQTVRIEGPLAFLWRRIVGDGVVRSLPQQTDSLVERARNA